VVVRFSVWDDWELLEEYDTSNVKQAAYLQGGQGVIKSLVNNVYYYQDKLGSTTHIADGSGHLLESYRYDLYGTPSCFNALNTQLSTSNYGVNDLFAGERWIGQLGLYDLRNRFMSPELGRFLQTDPVGFQGDASNLYRYCHNDPEDFSDATGLVASDTSRPIPDRLWAMACLFDSGNSFVGSLLDFFKRFLPAGMNNSNPVEKSSDGEAAANPKAFRGAYVNIHHQHDEVTTTDPIFVAGQPANSKTWRDLGPPHAVVGADGKIHFSQTIFSKTTYHDGPSAELRKAEEKRVSSVWAAKVALDTKGREAAARYFSSAAQAEGVIGKATAREWEIYKLQSSMLFEGFNKDGGTR
jgi:RHS repeat-associated protein